MTCRTCGSQKPNLKALFGAEDDDGFNLAAKLERITGYNIDHGDCSSKQICTQCKNILQMSFEFQQMATDKELLLIQQNLVQEVEPEQPEMSKKRTYTVNEERSSPKLKILKVEENVFLETDANVEDIFLDEDVEEIEEEPKPEEYKCECGRVFHSEKALNLHVRLVHQKQQAVVLRVPKTIVMDVPKPPTPIKVIANMLASNTKPSTQNSFQVEVFQNEQPDPQRYLCECGKEFFTDKAYTLHRKLVHKVRTIKMETITEANDISVVEGKGFDCTICAQSFHTTKALNLHTRFKHKW